MSIWTTLGGAAIGLALGGPLGALAGGIAASVAGNWIRDRHEQLDNNVTSSAAFTIGVIALGAKMAKADGVVTRDEVDAFKNVFRIPASEMGRVAKLFDLAKQEVDGYEMYARQLSDMFRRQPQMLEAILDGLFFIAKADGIVHPSELHFLRSVAAIFGFNDEQFSYISARHIRDVEQEDPYKILGLKRASSDAEIKKTYRNLVREHHPDRLMAQGVPEEMIAIATEKIAKINAAYDLIAKERRL